MYVTVISMKVFVISTFIPLKKHGKKILNDLLVYKYTAALACAHPLSGHMFPRYTVFTRN